MGLEALKKVIDERLAQKTPSYLRASAFTDKKITDTPTDALSVVNRKFVTLNGTTALRPTSPITGQSYFDTTLGKPIWWDGVEWVDATGSSA